MSTKEELYLILTLLRKHNLPLSPILEYAINEKIDECSGEGKNYDSINNEGKSQVVEESDNLFGKIEAKKQEPLETDSNLLRVVEFGKRGVAVVGDTKSHRISLKAMGGYYMPQTVYGPAWVFPSKKRKRVQAYIDGDTSVVDSWEDEDSSKMISKKSSRYIISVTYPDGRVFCSNLVWETLVDVIKYARPERVKRLHIICMGDNLVSSKLNENSTYRAAQKSIGDGLYVCTYSSTDTKLKQIERINKVFNLGLNVEKVYIDEKDETLNQGGIADDNSNSPVSTDDKRIGYTIRLLPSLLEGMIVRTKVDKNGVKKLIVKTNLSGDVLEINDLPYLYEILQRKTKKNDEDEVVVMTPKVNTDVLREYNNVEEHYESVEKSERIATSILPSEVEEIEHVYLDEKENVIRTEIEREKAKSQETESKDAEKTIEDEPDSDLDSSVKIGTRVRLFPSQIEGVVVNHIISKSGERRIVIEKDDGSRMSAQDHPYLYKILKKRRNRISDTKKETERNHKSLLMENESTRGNVIKEQFRSFLARRKPISTANAYTSTLDSAIRKMIKQEVDDQADSIFSYTTAEDVQICIDLLKETPDFREDNARRHNGLTAALNQYLLFIEEMEKGNMN